MRRSFVGVQHGWMKLSLRQKSLQKEISAKICTSIVMIFQHTISMRTYDIGYRSFLRACKPFDARQFYLGL